MKNKLNYYAIQVEIETGEKLLSWNDKNHFYFSTDKKCPAPILFRSKSEAKSALENSSDKKGNLKQFKKVVEAKKVRIVKIQISCK